MDRMPNPYSIDFNVKVRALSNVFAPNYKIVEHSATTECMDAYMRGVVYCPAPTEGMVTFFDSRGVAEEFCALLAGAAYYSFSAGGTISRTAVHNLIIARLIQIYGTDEKVLEAIRIFTTLILKLPADEEINGPVLNYRTFVEQYKKEQ